MPTNASSDRILVPERSVSVNDVSLTGSVVHTFTPDGRDDLIVLTLATNGGRSGRSNFPKVTWYGDRARKVIEDLEVCSVEHPRVCIKATIQTSKKGEGENTVHYQTIVGVEMTFAPKELEGKLNMDIGNRYIPDENEVVLVGEVVHTYHFGPRGAGPEEKPVGSILTIRTRNSNWPNYPKVTFFRQLCQTAQKVQEGDIVAVSGTIQTSREERGDRNRYFETVVGTDLDWYRA